MRLSDDGGTVRLAARAATTVSDRDQAIDLSRFGTQSALGEGREALAGRSVLIATRDQALSALAMVELDGYAGRIVIAPPDLTRDHRANVIEDAAVEAIVADDPGDVSEIGLPVVTIGASRADFAWAPERTRDTEWVLLTSGTSGRPKMVVHTLGALVGAIANPPPGTRRAKWATFYDIRRYGGLQILLRALMGGCDLVLSSEGEAIRDHLHRLAAAGVTAMSGTPSHWRRVLMSGDRGGFSPDYIRLSGEIADQFVLDGLRAAFPEAAIGHAYASTEAGVGFAVDDGREGFPAALVDQPRSGLEMKVVDGTLRIRSSRVASRYLGPDAPALVDGEGYVDTGDLVERRDGRYYFVGRRGGIINVGGLKVNPEEVEATLNGHVAVRMSLVRARRNPLTGAIVVADVVLRDPAQQGDALKLEIQEMCRAQLERHKVPVMIQFVPSLALTPAGKLSRANG